MALPFDLRACAYGDDGGADARSDPADRSGRRTSVRSFQAISIAPSLITRVQAREVEAFRELVRLTYAALVRFAETFVHSHDAAQDVVQDVFTVIWDRGPDWRPTSDAVAYLFGTVRNHALMEIRRRAREGRRFERMQSELISDSGSSIESTNRSALETVVETETEAARFRLLEKVLSTCTERQRTAYELRYHRGLTIPAIAQVLDITVKGAEQLVRRVTHMVLTRLRQEVAEAE